MKKRALIIMIPICLVVVGIVMDKTRKKNWFEGSIRIDGTLLKVENSLKKLEQHYLGVIKNMPGLTAVELLDVGSNFLTIKTSEGVMKRTDISMVIADEKITVEFDEEYSAGKMITTRAHFIEQFEVKGNGLLFHLKIGDLEAPGFLGFFYRNFGSKNIGEAFLNANRQFLEKIN
jgi:hypothetical protein